MVLLFVLIIFTSIGWIEPVQSQEKYPTRAIDIIIPFAPGGTERFVGSGGEFLFE